MTLTKLFLPTVPGVRVDRVWWEGHTLHMAAVTTHRAAQCPLCGRHSTRIHSFYGRTIADLPCVGAVLTLHLRTRRFVCRVRWCRRKIFTERLPALVRPWARRTIRLREHLQRTGFDLGGAAGTRHARAAGMPVSQRTLLRLVRAAPAPEAGAVRVLGVDDWAQKRGRVYGTILVNLETHQVLDLLPDRSAAALATWLRRHPEIEVVSRDRAEAYADGIRQGAPQAVQVADRFHLLKNVTDSLERFLQRKHRCLRQAAPTVTTTPPNDTAASVPSQDTTDPTPRRLTRHERAHQESRARRLARYEEVLALRAQGHSLRAVARVTGLSPKTVRRYAQAEGVPECQPRRRRRTTLLAPFAAYLQERWATGCHNARVLYQDLRERGYRGGYTQLTDYVRPWRLALPGRPCPRGARPAAPLTFGARQTLWLLLRADERLTEEERAYLAHLYHACPHTYLAQALVLEFFTVLQERDVPGLYAWLRRAETCPIAEIAAVARGMWADKRAIEAAVSSPWSQGPVEGSVNKLNNVSEDGWRWISPCQSEDVRRSIATGDGLGQEWRSVGHDTEAGGRACRATTSAGTCIRMPPRPRLPERSSCACVNSPGDPRPSTPTPATWIASWPPSAIHHLSGGSRRTRVLSSLTSTIYATGAAHPLMHGTGGRRMCATFLAPMRRIRRSLSMWWRCGSSTTT